MKKYLSFVFAFCFFALLASGCAEKENDFKFDDSYIESPDSSVNQAQGVDIDLTQLSSTLVMAEVNNILANSAKFMGKTIKISGPYLASYYEVTDTIYHYVVIDACCMGFEFILNDGLIYPEDGTDIEVVGAFGSYEELGKTYYYLAVNELEILE